MDPTFELSWLAIGLCVVAFVVIGFLWYGPLFGKAWAREMKMEDVEPTSAEMGKAMALHVLGAFLVVFVLTHNQQVWHPSVWGLPEPEGASPMAYAGMSAFFTWLGFFVPVQLGRVAWERASLKLFAINATYWFVMLFLSALILETL
jgi:hypothetical protein